MLIFLYHMHNLCYIRHHASSFAHRALCFVKKNFKCHCREANTFNSLYLVIFLENIKQNQPVVSEVIKDNIISVGGIMSVSIPRILYRIFQLCVCLGLGKKLRHH